MTQVFGLKQQGVGVDTKHTYDDDLYIGTYNETHPFNIKDLDAATREHNKSAGIKVLLLASLMFLGALVFSKSNKNFISMPTPEHKTSVIKDSLVLDSTKILKNAFGK